MDLLTFGVPTSRKRRHSGKGRRSVFRKPHFESLEPRRVLATIVVTTNLDTTDPGDGLVSLREAVLSANIVPGQDTIEFADALTANGPTTIALTSMVGGSLGANSALLVTESLTIVGPGANLLTIDASEIDPTPDENNGDGGRIFFVSDGDDVSDHTFSLSGVTLTGGDVGAGEMMTRFGGAIGSFENLAISDVDFFDNYCVGRANNLFRGGGAVFLEINQGTSSFDGVRVVGNASGEGGGGLDVIANGTAQVYIRDSVIEFNNAGRTGGGMSLATSSGSPNIEVARTSVVGNVARSNGITLGGGGIAIFNSAGQNAVVRVRDTLVANNVAHGRGGGFTVSMGDNPPNKANTYITNCTITGNEAGESGGGINMSTNVFGQFRIEYSTIVFNSVNAVTHGDTYNQQRDSAGVDAFIGNASINHSIVAFNRDATDAHDNLGVAVRAPGSEPVTGAMQLSYTLVGFSDFLGFAEAPVGSPDANGNLIGGAVHGAIDPKIGALVTNGGATLSHSLLPGSPALNAGDPLAAAGIGSVPQFDQRGAPFGRVFGGRIDMGAVEARPNPLAGDYNLDGLVNAADYTVWRNTVGVANDLRADGSGPTVGVSDNTIDAHDYTFWKANYGNSLPAGGGQFAVEIQTRTVGVDRRSVTAFASASQEIGVSGRRLIPAKQIRFERTVETELLLDRIEYLKRSYLDRVAEAIAQDATTSNAAGDPVSRDDAFDAVGQCWPACNEEDLQNWRHGDN